MHQFPDDIDEPGDDASTVDRVPHTELKRFHFAALNLSVYFKPDPECDYDLPTLENLAGNTPGLVPHGRSGFTLNTYSEFFVHLHSPEFAPPYQFTLSGTHVHVGDVTPLARFMFDAYHDRDWHGEWETWYSIKLLGPLHGQAEAFLMSALFHLRRHDHDLRVASLTSVQWPPADSTVTQVPHGNFKAIHDVEPLRLYYYASADVDNMAACIHYYRIIEYYCFLTKHIKLDELRRDRNLSSRDFVRETAQLFAKHEQSDIVAFVAGMTPPHIVGEAHSSRLIGNNDRNTFAVALYQLRNSLVHSKYESTMALRVDSVVSPSDDLDKWRLILHELAQSTLLQFGT